MLVVVFGAGASYDSSPDKLPQPGVLLEDQDDDEAFRPPLAEQLFDLRELFAAELEKLPGYLRSCIMLLRRRAPNVTVEEVLEKMRLEAESKPIRHQQLAEVRYYLRSALRRCVHEWNRRVTRGVTNYGQLLGHIAASTNPGDEVCFVTFNYDSMLEAGVNPIPS
jgi:hypothetical protein